VVSVTSSPLHIAAADAAAAGVDSWSIQSNIGCGTKTQPWMLDAPAGQRINISLLDFTAAARLTSQHLTRSTSHIITTTSSSSSSGSCVDENHQYGYIIDKSSVNKKNVSVCHARSNRQTRVYLSTSNTLQMVLKSTGTDSHRDNFLLKVEGIIVQLLAYNNTKPFIAKYFHYFVVAWSSGKLVAAMPTSIELLHILHILAALGPHFISSSSQNLDLSDRA